MRIGPLLLDNNLVVAPMAGVTDRPFRALCRRLGAGLAVSEMIAADTSLWGSRKSLRRMDHAGESAPVAVQIVGGEPERLADAARANVDRGAQIIDVNMGCPAKSVAHIGGGVGLMKTPLKIARIFRKLSSALEVPVTGKIRLGWDDCRSFKLVARILEENGAALIAVHARTKEQGYGGEADWDAIAEIKSLVKIPVIGNGDVRTVADIERMKSHTGCDAVMIGRAAIGNPWIFSRLEREQVPPEEVRRMMRRHLERSMAFHGPRKGLVLFRKHALRYLKLQRLPRVTRTKIFTQDTPEGFLSLIDEVFAGLDEKSRETA